MSGFLLRLHVLYAPGSAAQRASILRHLEWSPGSSNLTETIAALRRRRRHLYRADEEHVPLVLLKRWSNWTGRCFNEAQWRCILATATRYFASHHGCHQESQEEQVLVLRSDGTPSTGWTPDFTYHWTTPQPTTSPTSSLNQGSAQL